MSRRSDPPAGFQVDLRPPGIVGYAQTLDPATVREPAMPLLPAILSCILLAFATLAAQEPAKVEKPEAADLLARHVKETGGKEAYLAIRSSRIKGKVETRAGRDLAGTLEVVFARIDVVKEGGKKEERLCYRLLLDFGDDLRVEQGSDGKVHWALTSYDGARLVSDDEARANLVDFDLAAAARPKDYYEKLETRGKVMVGKRPAWEVEVTRRFGARREFMRFDVETGMLVGTKIIEASENGDIVTSSEILGWREFGSIRIPDRTRDRGPGFEQSTTFDSGAIGPDLKLEDFAPPAAVKKLLDRPAPDPVREG